MEVAEVKSERVGREGRGSVSRQRRGTGGTVRWTGGRGRMLREGQHPKKYKKCKDYVVSYKTKDSEKTATVLHPMS